MEMIDRKQLTNASVDNIRKRNIYKSHTSDFYYTIQITFYMLKPIGAWPLGDDETSRLKVVLHKLSMMMGTIFLLFSFVPWIVKIVKEKWSIFLILRTISPLMFLITVFTRYVLLLWHQGLLKSCIDHVVDDWRCGIIVEDRDIMLANAKVGRTFGIVSVICMFSCGICYYSLPMALNKVNENNVTIKLHPSPCEFLVFDSKASPAYEIVYFLQVVAGWISYCVYSGICSLMANFVTHVCGQCDVLVAVFEEIVDGGKRNKGSIENRIASAVTRHLHLLRLVSNINNLFTEICFVEFINASCSICLIGYYIITDLNNNESFMRIFMYVFAFASIGFNIFIFCYIGDLLKEYCQKVATACYAIEWYRMPSKRAIDLIIPIMISRYPVTLSAGKILTMTLTTFSDMLRTSMAYLNLLREFSSEKGVTI